jgi:hypothetical protein
MVPIFIISVIVAAIAVFLVMKGRSELARQARIHDTPTTPAREVNGGFTEVKGVVEATEVITSPFYQTPAVMVRWSVEEHRRRGKHSHWITVLSGVESRDFFIRDESGRVRVPIGRLAPHLYLAGKNTTSSGTFRNAPEHIEAFLQSRGRSSTGWVFNKAMRYTEECISPGEHIYALGWTQRTADESTFREGPSGTELILANLTEEELARRIGSTGRWMVGGGAVLGLGAFTAVVWATLMTMR